MSGIWNHVRRNVVGYVALFVALGGTSYAATALPDNSVGTSQLKNGAVTNSKLHARAVNASKVAANSLGGGQISESTLGKVPTAHQADSAINAQKLAGVPLTGFDPAGATTWGAADIHALNGTGNDGHVMSDGPLTLNMTCTDKGSGSYELVITATSTVAATMGFTGSQGTLSANTPVPLIDVTTTGAFSRVVPYTYVSDQTEVLFNGLLGYGVHTGSGCTGVGTAVNAAGFM